jgi:hypothetical protein
VIKHVAYEFVFQNELVENIPTCPVNSDKRPLDVVNIFPILHSRRKPPDAGPSSSSESSPSSSYRSSISSYGASSIAAALSSSLGKICDGRCGLNVAPPCASKEEKGDNIETFYYS